MPIDWPKHPDLTQRMAAAIYRAFSPIGAWPPDREPTDDAERAAWARYEHAARAAIVTLMEIPE